MDLEKDFIEKTVEMSKEANDEMWRMQWDAVLNLRILNKYYYEALCGQLLLEMADFIKGQIENLRSNNSRNSLQLFSELFSENLDKYSNTDGKKVDELWVTIVEKILPTVLKMTYADK